MELQSLGCEVFGNVAQPELSTDGIKNIGSGDYAEASHTIPERPLNEPFAIELKNKVVCKKIMFYPRAERFHYVDKISLYGSNTRTSNINQAIFIGDFTAITEENRLTTFTIANENPFKYYIIVNRSEFNGSLAINAFYWVEVELYGTVYNDKEPNFPVKVGNESHVEEYSKTLTKGEEQLLVTREGSLYLTDGQGSYISVGTVDLPEIDLSNYYTKTEVDGLIPDITELATKNELKEAIDNIVIPPGGDVDLTNYYTKDETYNKEEVDTIVKENSVSFNMVSIPRKKGPFKKEAK